MTLTRLLFLPDDPAGPAECWTLDDGALLTREELAVGSPAHETAPTVLVVPGQDVAARWLTPPGRSHSQVEAAAAMMIQEQLAGQHEPLHVAVGSPDASGRRLTLAVAASRLDGWMAAARDLGVEPCAVAPDYLLLAPRADEVLSAARFGERVAVRGRDLAFTTEADLLELVAADREVAWVDPADLGQAFVAGLGQLEPDLKPRPRRAPLTWRDARLAAGLALALAATPLLITAAGAAADERAARTAQQQLSGLATEALGTHTPAHEAAEALRARRLALAATDGFSRGATNLFATLETVEGASLEGLLHDESGLMRATISYRDYADVGALVAGAEERGLVLEEVSAIDERGVRAGDFIVRPR